jgi:N-acetylmuramoyl-L-alanine amidase
MKKWIVYLLIIVLLAGNLWQMSRPKPEMDKNTEVFVVKVIVEHYEKPKTSLWAEFEASQDYELLVRLLYHEARGEGVEGKKEVVRVVLNRVNSQNFPDTIRDVIFQPRQFSPSHLIGNPMDEKYREEIGSAIKEVMIEGEGLNDGSLYFVNASIADMGNYGWFKNLEYVKTIEAHEFYR